MENLLDTFINEFKKALFRKTSWGRNHLFRLIDEIEIKILTEALKERGYDEKGSREFHDKRRDLEETPRT
jgi:hypothetical protein